MEVFLQTFKTSFEGAPDEIKRLMAPSLVPLYKDMYKRLECQPEDCEDKNERLEAIQYAIDYMTPYTEPPVPPIES